MTKSFEKTTSLNSVTALIESNWQIRMLYLERNVSSVEVVIEPDVTIVRSSIPDDSFNFVMSAKFNEENVEKGVAHVLSLFSDKKTPLCWWVSPSDTPKNLDKYLKDNQFQLRAENAAAYLNVKEYKEPQIQTSEELKQFKIERVNNQDKLQDFCYIIIQTFDENRKVYDLFYSKLPPELYTNKAPYEIYVGYLNETPVASATLLDDAGVCGVYYLSTLPQYRERGIATVMLKHMIQRTAEKKRDFITLQGAPEARNFYKKFGFVEVGSFKEYVKKQQDR